MKKVKLQQVDIKDRNEEYGTTQVGIKYDGGWRSGFVKDDQMDVVKGWNQGDNQDTVLIVEFDSKKKDDNGNAYKNFKLPTKMEMTVLGLVKDVKELKAKVFGETSTVQQEENKMSETAQPNPEPPQDQQQAADPVDDMPF